MTDSRARIGKSAGTRTCPRRTSRLCLDAGTRSRSHTGTGPPTPRWQASLEVIRCFAKMHTKERPTTHPLTLVRGREVAHRSLASATVARIETASSPEQRRVLAPLSCRFAKTNPPTSPPVRGYGQTSSSAATGATLVSQGSSAQAGLADHWSPPLCGQRRLGPAKG